MSRMGSFAALLVASGVWVYGVLRDRPIFRQDACCPVLLSNPFDVSAGDPLLLDRPGSHPPLPPPMEHLSHHAVGKVTSPSAESDSPRGSRSGSGSPAVPLVPPWFDPD